MKNKIIILINIILIIIFFIIGIWVRDSEEGILFDESVMDYVHSKTTIKGIKIMKIITFLGSAYFLFPLGIIIFLFMAKNKNLNGILLLILSTLGSYGLNFIFKNIFIRVRPLEYFLIEQSGYSFPSGHAMVSMSFYTTMTYLICKKLKKPEFNTIFYIVNFIIVVIIGFSRIYLGVHWPTDVLMGFIMGLVFTYTSIKSVLILK